MCQVLQVRQQEQFLIRVAVQVSLLQRWACIIIFSDSISVDSEVRVTVTNLLLHQEYLFILCVYLFVMHQLHRTKENKQMWTLSIHAVFRQNKISSSYFSHWRLCDEILEWIFRSDCCEVFVQDCNFLLIIPSRWTRGKQQTFFYLIATLTGEHPLPSR